MGRHDTLTIKGLFFFLSFYMERDCWTRHDSLRFTYVHVIFSDVFCFLRFIMPATVFSGCCVYTTNTFSFDNDNLLRILCGFHHDPQLTNQRAL